MYLLNIEALKLEAFNDRRTIPHYGILSHTWGEGEVLYNDLQESPHLGEIRELRERLQALESSSSKQKRVHRPEQKGIDGEPEKDERESDPRLWRVRQKKGWFKVEGCCKEASKHGLSYVWIDTCCINKDSSAELSEAINSMFAWYREAVICFAYLSEVNHDRQGPGSFHNSRWFSRGWTLQELIAPSEVLFFSGDWSFMFTRSSSADVIAKRTGIDASILGKRGLERISSFCVAEKMAWASHRLTTREEDSAYALMGLFGVNMPIIYGEGQEAAFFRLQREIFNVTGDHSIFAWYSGYATAFLPILDESGSDINTNRILLGEMVHYKDLDQYLRAINQRLSSHSRRDDPPSNLFSLSPSQVGFGRSVSVMPYGFEQLELSESANKTTSISAKYSAASHGLRVQLMLQPLIQRHVGVSFYLAHLACKVDYADQSGRVGIVLISKERGSYQRPAPMELVVINEPIPEPSELMLEDIYISMPQPKIASSGANDEFPSAEFVFPTQVRLIDEQFQDSGFMMRDFAPSPRMMHTEPSGHIVSSSASSSLGLDRTVVTFYHPWTTEKFAVALFLYSASIWVDIGSGTASQILRLFPKADMVVNDLRKEILLTRLPGGRTVFISIKNDTPQRCSYNILVKGSFDLESASEPPVEDEPLPRWIELAQLPFREPPESAKPAQVGTRQEQPQPGESKREAASLGVPDDGIWLRKNQ
jgi:hypothetical protein